MTTTYILDTGIFAEEEEFQRLFHQMPDYRQEKINKLQQKKDKLLSLGAGVLLQYGYKLAEGRLPEEKPSEMQICFGAHGKPYFANRRDLFFSISHSGTKVICAFSDGEVGADIQQISPVKDTVIKRVCTSTEQKYLETLDTESRQQEFYRFWTAKESFMKLTGEGLSLSPEQIEIQLQEGKVMPDKNQEASFREYPLEGYHVTVCGISKSFSEDMLELTLEAIQKSIKNP